jgi:hypothetical protein
MAKYVSSIKNEDYDISVNDYEDVELVSELTPEITKDKLNIWNAIDFEKDARERQKIGITQEEFFEDVKIWDEVIHNLPKYNEEVFMQEIDNMDFNIPKNEFDFKELQGVYSRLVSLFARLSEMRSNVYSHYETFIQAYKCLKQYSMGFFAGTAQVKESSAEHLVHRFYQYSIKPKILLAHIDDTIKVVEFAATNMNRILREKEANNKINGVHQYEGQAHNFSKLTSDSGNSYFANEEGDDDE